MEIGGARLGAALITTLFFRCQCPLWTLPRSRASSSVVSLFPTLPPHSEVKGSLKSLPLGHLVSPGKTESPCGNLGLGILVLLVKLEDTLTGRGGVGVDSQRAGL